ncbi:MAG: DUF2490 domain-containing protein [Bacteroidales bacterium]|nr:DUF2490 domain-containing protein [Bacteroidales bacterium]
MKRLLLTVALAALPLCLAHADDPDQFGTRYSAKVNYKLMPGLHLTASEELRLGSSFDFNKTTSSVGATYKIDDWLKVGLDYSAIGVNKKSGLDWRHRLALGVSESYKGYFLHFSLKETLQATYRVKEDMDTYQYPRTKLVFKTRAKVTYKPIHSRFTPYAQAEMRLLLNGANWTSADGIVYSFEGHNDLYMDRIRLQAGTKFNLAKEHAIELFLHYDYLVDKDIDYSRTDGVLKSITITKYPYLGLGFGYEFSF